MIKQISLIIFVQLLLVFAASAQEKNISSEKSPASVKAINYGLVVDNSGSYRTIFTEVLNSVNEIIEAHNPGDEAFLVRFVDSNKVSLLQEITASKAEMSSATEELFIEGGQTAILDSVYFSAKYLAENAPNENQKVLILITDGEDRKSAAKIEDVVKFLKEQKIQIFALGISDEKIHKQLLEKLARESGGKSFLVEKRLELKNIVKELNVAVRAR